MCTIVVPKRGIVSSDEARQNLKKTIKDAKDLNTSLRKGTWKPAQVVHIVSSEQNN